MEAGPCVADRITVKPDNFQEPTQLVKKLHCSGHLAAFGFESVSASRGELAESINQITILGAEMCLHEQRCSSVRSASTSFSTTLVVLPTKRCNEFSDLMSEISDGFTLTLALRGRLVRFCESSCRVGFVNDKIGPLFERGLIDAIKATLSSNVSHQQQARKAKQ